MVGLAQFLPTAVLIFAAGHVADRYDRKRVVQICQTVAGLTAAFLAWGSFAGWLNMPEIFTAVAVFGAPRHLIWLSVLSLAVMGAADTVSVVIRLSQCPLLCWVAWAP